MSIFQKKLIPTVCSVVLGAAIFGILSAATTSEAFQKHLYHEQPTSEEIVIVYIDDASLSDDALGRWQDWSREYYATAISNLEQAETIGIDLVFSQKSKGLSEEDLISTLTENNYSDDLIAEQLSYLEENHPDDLTLAEALEESGNVFLTKFPYIDDSGEIIYEVKSIDLIAEASAGEGYSYGEVSQSDTIFKINAQESFDSKIANHFSGEEKEIPTDSDENMYINYTGSTGSYKSLSFADVYSNNFDPEEIANKIVLIGIGAATLQDRYTTPIGAITMPGVEIHANAIQTILDENFLQPATPTQKIAILTTLTILAATLFMYLNILWTIPALATLAVTYWILAQLAFNRGLILDLVYPFLALLTLYIATMLFRYFTEIQSRKQVVSAFGHYVSKDVVDDILKNPKALKLGGEKREITSFFIDIADFTKWSESTEPEKLVTQLNEYFSAISEIIMKNQGTVDKFEGDAIVAFWNAPLEVENHEELACKTALEAHKTLKELNKNWTTKIHFRIGINTGEAVIGNLGSKDRFDYTAIGDTVNLASRLEGANKFYKTEIITSGNTATKLTKKFEFRRLDQIRVKGKESAIAIYELLAEKNTLPEKALAIINKFHQAIEYYRNADWEGSKARFEEVLKHAPEDGPTQTYLARIEELKKNPPKNWDGTWRFGEK